jgi:hypothetical protein
MLRMLIRHTISRLPNFGCFWRFSGVSSIEYQEFVKVTGGFLRISGYSVYAEQAGAEVNES